jgi:hypothetical protein
MRYAAPPLRRAALRLLAYEAGDEPATSERLAAASTRLIDRLSERLAEVIGGAGIEAIWLRAIRLRMAEFPFLEKCIRGSGNSRSEALRACLTEQEPDIIREASVLVFATIAGLLGTVVGEALTWKLCRAPGRTHSSTRAIFTRLRNDTAT